MLWFMRLVAESCITSPFSLKVCFRFSGFATNSLGTMNGPSGAKVSWFLPTSQSDPPIFRSPRPPRSETSIWMV